MAVHGKELFKGKIKGILNGNDLDVWVYGIFNTKKLLWTYYLISTNASGSSTYLTDDICSVSTNNYYPATVSNISQYGVNYQNVEEAKKHFEEFKIKWETGSNNTTAEIRDKKLDEILKP